MRGSARTAWVAAIACACVLAVTATAFAAGTLRVQVTPKSGVYGTEIVVQPSIEGTVVVGDKVELYALDNEDIWQKYGEGQLVEANEETGSAPVIEPLYLHIDDSMSYPAVLRATYVPKTGTAYHSEPFRIRLVKNTKTAVKITAPASVRAGREFISLFEVLPNSGIGKVRVTIKKVAGAGTFRKTMTLTTDEEGGIEQALKFATAGSYRVSAKFLGNTFGVASPTASRTIVVR